MKTINIEKSMMCCVLEMLKITYIHRTLLEGRVRFQESPGTISRSAVFPLRHKQIIGCFCMSARGIHYRNTPKDSSPNEVPPEPNVRDTKAFLSTWKEY